MLQVHSFNSDTTSTPQPTIWSEKRRGNRLDCETGVLLRQVLAPVFQTAQNWSALRHALERRGYDLRFEEGRLILIETMRGTKICSCRYLGHPLSDLTRRLGRLRARPPRSGARFGQLAI